MDKNDIQRFIEEHACDMMLFIISGIFNLCPLLALIGAITKMDMLAYAGIAIGAFCILVYFVMLVVGYLK